MTDKPRLPIVERLLSYDDERKPEHWEMHDAAILITELVEALDPIAKAADNFDGMNIGNAEEWFCYSGQSRFEGQSGAITVGDLRRARAAIRRAEGDADV